MSGSCESTFFSVSGRSDHRMTAWTMSEVVAGTLFPRLMEGALVWWTVTVERQRLMTSGVLTG